MHCLQPMGFVILFFFLLNGAGRDFSKLREINIVPTKRGRITIYSSAASCSYVCLLHCKRKHRAWVRVFRPTNGCIRTELYGWRILIRIDHRYVITLCVRDCVLVLLFYVSIGQQRNGGNSDRSFPLSGTG